MNQNTCLLCGERGAHARTGRLGRYALTCDCCEERRGTHLTAQPVVKPAVYAVSAR